MRIKNNEVLPIGTLVLLNNVKKDLIICSSVIKGGNITYEGLPYPYGYIDDRAIKEFNNKDIKEIHFYGYSNIDFQSYAKQMKLAIKKEDG